MARSHLASALGCAAALAFLPGLCDAAPEASVVEQEQALGLAGAEAAGSAGRLRSPGQLGSAAREAARFEAARAACPYGRELNGRAIELKLTFARTGRTAVLRLMPSGCVKVNPRDDEKPMPPFTQRDYRTPDGVSLQVYTGAHSPTSTASLSLPDGAASASLIPAFRTETLASGEPIDLGEVLLVRLGKGGEDDAVIHADMSIRTLPARGS